jgi:hypothetical protein
LDKQEPAKNPIEIEEWERNYLEEKGKSIDDRLSDQHQRLVDTIQSLNSIFGSVFITAIKKIRNETIEENELSLLQTHKDVSELIARVNGLEEIFGERFYTVLTEVLGEELFSYRERTIEETSSENLSEREREEEQLHKLPKGFNKWDLKQIKLHESNSAASGKTVLVRYWSLKGLSDTGEILYNKSKDLFYFRSQDPTKSTFALSDEQGRKATREARNYYFKVVQIID